MMPGGVVTPGPGRMFVNGMASPGFPTGATAISQAVPMHIQAVPHHLQQRTQSPGAPPIVSGGAGYAGRPGSLQMHLLIGSQSALLPPQAAGGAIQQGTILRQASTPGSLTPSQPGPRLFKNVPQPSTVAMGQQQQLDSSRVRSISPSLPLQTRQESASSQLGQSLSAPVADPSSLGDASHIPLVPVGYSAAASNSTTTSPRTHPLPSFDQSSARGAREDVRNLGSESLPDDPFCGNSGARRPEAAPANVATSSDTSIAALGIDPKVKFAGQAPTYNHSSPSSTQDGGARGESMSEADDAGSAVAMTRPGAASEIKANGTAGRRLGSQSPPRPLRSKASEQTRGEHFRSSPSNSRRRPQLSLNDCTSSRRSLRGDNGGHWGYDEAGGLATPTSADTGRSPTSSRGGGGAAFRRSGSFRRAPTTPGGTTPSASSCSSPLRGQGSRGFIFRTSSMHSSSENRLMPLAPGCPVTFLLENRPQPVYGQVRHIAADGTYVIDLVGGGRMAGIQTVTRCHPEDLFKAESVKRPILTGSKCAYEDWTGRYSIASQGWSGGHLKDAFDKTLSNAGSPKNGPGCCSRRGSVSSQLSYRNVVTDPSDDWIGMPCKFICRFSSKEYYGRVRAVDEDCKFCVELVGGGRKMDVDLVTPISEEEYTRYERSRVEGSVWMGRGDQLKELRHAPLDSYRAGSSVTPKRVRSLSPGTPVIIPLEGSTENVYGRVRGRDNAGYTVETAKGSRKVGVRVLEPCSEEELARARSENAAFKHSKDRRDEYLEFSHCREDWVPPSAASSKSFEEGSVCSRQSTIGIPNLRGVAINRQRSSRGLWP
eukprot:TRINITY_DN20248_c0_g1_i4.p1 TRINITY_DN20248_c0_g1~~TRINITY_DN20248_c0_g1_i4.p1  ORF type:complete len:824 (+),score=79.18 TRINITY_DN20248_c0_g1_i4:146-2617(+)